MFRVILAFFSFSSPFVLANDVSVLFHPYDPNLKQISKVFDQAESTIDMALYNIDSTDKNPVIQWILKDETQRRIHNGHLHIRLLFEGFESAEATQKKMLFFEKMGVDVKTLGRSQKMHHKFAVIDGYKFNSKLISGSANWSLMSQRQFNENTLFFANHPKLIQNFQQQFELLWRHSDEIGLSKIYNYTSTVQILNPRPGVKVYFNTDNYRISDSGQFRKKPVENGYVLTRQLVLAIDSAKKEIEIATTRIKLRPVYNAILRASKRGVKVKIVVTMQSYEKKYKRNRALMRKCVNEYHKKCSTSQDFALLLERNKYPGKDNVEVRIKYFHVSKDAYLSKQMHSKYMIIDGQSLLTGSFNWSYSAEYGHIENLLVLDQFYYPTLMEEFKGDFNYLWSMGRSTYDSTIDRFETAVRSGKKTSCAFSPMTLTYEEIDYLLGSGKRAGGSLTKACKKT